MVFELHIQAEYSNIFMGNYHFSTRQGIFLYRCVVAISVFIVYKIRNLVKSALLWQRLNALFLRSEYKVMVLSSVSYNKSVILFRASVDNSF